MAKARKRASRHESSRRRTTSISPAAIKKNSSHAARPCSRSSCPTDINPAWMEMLLSTQKTSASKQYDGKPAAKHASSQRNQTSRARARAKAANTSTSREYARQWNALFVERWQSECKHWTRIYLLRLLSWAELLRGWRGFSTDGWMDGEAMILLTNYCVLVDSDTAKSPTGPMQRSP